MTTLFISHSSKDKAWAERTHQALADGGYQCLFLDSHPDDGIHAGADWEQTLYQRLRQSRGVVVLCSANWLASPWCVAEAMMARERKRRVFLLAKADVIDGRQVKGAQEAAPQIPEFLKDKQFISLTGTTEEAALQQLLQGLEREGLRKKDFKLPDRPYPGLKPFGENDGAIFFGRDEEIDQVIDVLHRRRKGNANGFVLVLGASGCGKSSLVRAGVLPQLTHGVKGASAAAEWVIVPPFVGGRGLDGLALALAEAFQSAAKPREFSAVRGQLAAASDLRTLAYELLLAHHAKDGSVLIVLDQLEEVFGTPEGSDARDALRLLLDASADAASPVVVLATMRSDFLNAFQLFEGSAGRYQGIPLDPMPRSRFGEVIIGPADRFGLELEPGLADRMKEDAAYADALPLLAYTLERLYADYGGDGKLELAEYEKLFPAVEVREADESITIVRGVSAAIMTTADEILKAANYKGLPDDDPRKRDLRRAFYSLAQVGEEGAFTRRTAKWRDLEDYACTDVLERFVDQRLLVSDNTNNERTLTVAHEALFRVWDTLNAWLRRDRKALALRSQIEAAAAEWQAAKQAESRAWPEERILDAVREIDRSGVSLADVTDRNTVDAFLGPTDPKDLEDLPALGAAEDETAGSNRYGEVWRLPLGHEARASVGARLALLGDHRKGVGLRADDVPDIDWVQIDGGEVTIEIRANSDDPNSRVVNRLAGTVGPFWMARYPVTIAQFQAFLDECHHEDGWHLPPGSPFDLGAEYPRPKHRAHHGNHPADSVNWFDACAFCHWLGERLEFELRLPTEYEWQQAATGGDSIRTYPWGPDWDPATEPWRANTLESELGRSTAVGMYPAGASSADILDMGGTLWEWCQNEFDDPNNTAFPASEEDRRVLRGGSWDSYQVYARAAFRNRNYPSYRNDYFGFRVVCSSPSSGH